MRWWLRVTLGALCAAAACRYGGMGGSGTPVGAVAGRPALGRVHGRVVDRVARRPLARRIVIVGGQRTTTDVDGTFVLTEVPDVYDLVILDAGRERVTVYQKLSRRDPWLVHEAPAPADEWSAEHSARIYSNPTIDGRPPVGGATTAFFSRTVGAVGDPAVLHWRGPARVDGEVLVVAVAGDTSASGGAAISAEVLSGWAGRVPFSVTPSLAATIDMPLALLPRTRVRGTLSPPPGFRVSTLIESYRVPIPGGDLPIRRDERDGLRGIDDQLPDGAGVGASLCVTALGDGEGEGEGTTRTTRCRRAADGTFSLTLDRPPTVTAPAHAAAFERDTVFSWRPSTPGVQVLNLQGQGAEASRPNVTIYTPATSVDWKVLAGTDLAFPRGCSIYQVTAGGRGPYASMDQAFAPDGVGALIPTETRSTESAPITVTVPHWPRPEPGSFEAKLCHYPAGQGVVCELPTTADNGEYYILSAINNKLRNFPAFTRSIGIYCVHDCETARRFMKAWRAYSVEHPGFDANEPLDMESC